MDGPWKLHRIESDAGRVTWELYHLADDRTESQDRLKDEPTRVAALQRDLERWLQSVAQSLNSKDY